MSDESKKDDGEIVIECSPYADSETEVVKLEDAYKIKDMLDVFSPEDISVQVGIQITIIAFIAIIACFSAIYVLSKLAVSGLSFGSSIRGMAESVSFSSRPDIKSRSPSLTNYKNTIYIMVLTVIVTMLVLGIFNYLNIIDLNYITRISGDETVNFFSETGSETANRGSNFANSIISNPITIFMFIIIIIKIIYAVIRVNTLNKARKERLLKNEAL